MPSWLNWVVLTGVLMAVGILWRIEEKLDSIDDKLDEIRALGNTSQQNEDYEPD
jgi:hypothetical protein